VGGMVKDELVHKQLLQEGCTERYIVCILIICDQRCVVNIEALD
jgi:hypothetical protein